MVEIDELSSKVNYREGEGSMPANMRQYIREVAAEAVEDYLRRQQQLLAERRITGGVRDELEGEA